MQALAPHEYRVLLRVALPPVVDADTLDPNIQTLFTPDSHRNALDPDVTVVKGGRGVGKTVWFKALQDESLREFVAAQYRFDRINRIEPLIGFGLERSDRYPSQRILQSLLQQYSPLDIWTTVALHALNVREIRERTNWDQRVGWLREHPEEAEQAFVDADREAQRTGKTKLLLFDAIDRLHSERMYNDELVRGILQLALDLRTTTRQIRSKVFIRHDMFGEAQLNFPDSSKLTSNSVDLAWSPRSLFALLFHHLGNADSDYAATFRSLSGWVTNNLNNPILPRNLIGDEARQREVFVWIAGKYMGTDHRKGYTYTWLPNHLADGQGQVSPRSFLSALRTATDETEENFSGSKVALHWDAIRRGVQRASKIRVEEVKEDIRWVPKAIGPLHGLQVPIDQRDVEARWQEQDLRADLAQLASVTASGAEESSEKPPPTGPLHQDYSGLIDELIALGVMTRRKNGKLDLPDVYRIAFDLGRKGGVPRVKA